MKLTPRKARTLAQRASLQRDNVAGRKAELYLTHAGVVVNQRTGEGSVVMTRGDFERFVRFYFKAQKTRKR